MQKFKIFYLGKQHSESTWHSKVSYFLKYSPALLFIFLSHLFFDCFFNAKTPLLSNLFTSSVHSQLQPVHIEVINFFNSNSELFEVWKIILSFLMSLLFPFHLSMLFVQVVMVLWFCCASWLCAELSLFLIHLSSSSPFIWRLPENTPVSTRKWSLAEKEAYSFILQMNRTI